MRTVMIIGGGVGGLALAHGLKRAGHPVDVYERTTERSDWLQGYRIHINPKGAEALRNCLEPAAWQRFLDTVSADDGGFGFMTDRGRDLLRFGVDEIVAGHYGVSRINLREILLSGLDDELHLGKAFERYETTQNGVTASFADGTTATADVLIGADGANSRVRRQLLPHAERIDTGVVAVAGKFRLTPGAPLPAELRRDANIVIPRRRGSLFTAVWHADKTATDREDTDREDTDREDTDREDYAFWAYADAADQFPAEPESLDGAALRSLILDRTAGWSPGLRTLIAGADPATVNGFHVKSATPVEPWESGPVTLLGDAIHNMTPMAGVGANTALRDADLLRRTLINNQSFHVYERQMLEYGFAAVRQSLRNAKQAGRPGWAGRAVFRTILRATAKVPPMRRAMARTWGS